MRVVQRLRDSLVLLVFASSAGVGMAMEAAPNVFRCRTAAVLPPQPTLDLEELEARLRETDAIGFFTKLELKGQVDDLLEEVRNFHHEESELSIEELHERFNLLMLKVLSLLQDDDPGLSADIAMARAALWTVLSDPARFAQQVTQG